MTTTATASPIAASKFAQTRSPDVDTVWGSDDGDTSYTQWVNLTGFSGGEGVYQFPDPFDYDSPAGSTVTAVTLTVTARQTASDGYLGVGMQAPDGMWVLGTSSAYADLEQLALTGSWQTFTFTVTGLSQQQGGAGTAETSWSFRIAEGDGSPAAADESVRMSFVSAEFTLEPASWPLWFKTADGRDFRIGPDANPDGGICYFIGADGTAWVQGAGSSGTFNLDADGFTYHGAFAGEFTDDGQDSAHTFGDGKKVRWPNVDATLGDDTTWLDVTFPDPPDMPVDSVAITTNLAFHGGSTFPPATVIELVASDGTTVIESFNPAAGLVFPSGPPTVADLTGCIWRIHYVTADYHLLAADLDRVRIAITGTIPARPVDFIGADGAVKVTLPMIPAS